MKRKPRAIAYETQGVARRGVSSFEFKSYRRRERRGGRLSVMKRSVMVGSEATSDEDSRPQVAPQERTHHRPQAAVGVTENLPAFRCRPEISAEISGTVPVPDAIVYGNSAEFP